MLTAVAERNAGKGSDASESVDEWRDATREPRVVTDEFVAELSRRLC